MRKLSCDWQCRLLCDESSRPLFITFYFARCAWLRIESPTSGALGVFPGQRARCIAFPSGDNARLVMEFLPGMLLALPDRWRRAGAAERICAWRLRLCGPKGRPGRWRNTSFGRRSNFAWEMHGGRARPARGRQSKVQSCRPRCRGTDCLPECSGAPWLRFGGPSGS